MAFKYGKKAAKGSKKDTGESKSQKPVQKTKEIKTDRGDFKMKGGC